VEWIHMVADKQKLLAVLNTPINLKVFFFNNTWGLEL